MENHLSFTTFSNHTKPLSENSFAEKSIIILLQPQLLHQTQLDPVKEGSKQGTTMEFKASDFRGSCPIKSRSLYRHHMGENGFPASLSINANHSKTPSKSKKRYNSTPPSASFSWNCSGGGGRMPPPRHASPRSRSCTPIMFSNSRGMLKPPPIEKRLECTLEELCYGCQKRIKIIREVLTDTGGKVQEEEMLTIKVKPGWKKGTRITFEGKGNERPGSYREDIIFIISEKRHKLFRREGDDLDLGLEIPLVKALTGCTVSVPLLGGEKMSLTVDDIIYAGYETIVTGQGMPISKEPGKRGNLRITFLVAFPKQLTDDQRSEVSSILQDYC